MGCCVGFGFEGLTFLRWIRLGLERVFFFGGLCCNLDNSSCFVFQEATLVLL